MEPGEREDLEQERLGDEFGVVRSRLERAQAGEEEEEQPGVALVVLGGAVDDLGHRLAGQMDRADELEG